MVPRRRWAGKQPRRHAGTEGHRNADTQERERAGTQARRHAGTQARKHTSTQARGHAGTEARRHASAQAGRQASRQTRPTPTLRKRAKTAPQKIEQSLVLRKGSQPVPGWVEVPALKRAGSSPEFTPSRGGLGFKVPQPQTPRAESPRHGDWEFHPEAVSWQLHHQCHIASHVFWKSVPADVNFHGLSARAVMSWGSRVFAEPRCHCPPWPGAERWAGGRHPEFSGPRPAQM